MNNTVKTYFWVLVITMFCGRIGTLTIFSLFLLRKDNPIKYAEERVMVG